MNRVIVGDVDAGWKYFNETFCANGMDFFQNRRAQLIEFGVPEYLISMWEKGDNDISHYGPMMMHMIVTMMPAMERMSPDGCTRLGLYAKSIGDKLCGHCADSRIIDFGCGPWVDASIYFGKRLDCPTVRLMDVTPLPLYYAGYQVERAGIKHEEILLKQGEDSSCYVTRDTAMIIEATAFEHVVGIRHLFPKLMEALPSGAFFLTNYTRLDWTDPKFDGFQENKDFATDAVTAAMDLAYRYEWSPVQPEGEGWDLWERK